MAWFAWLYQMLCILLFSLKLQAILSASLPSSTHIDEGAALLQFKSTFSLNNMSSSGCGLVGIKSYPKTNSWKNGTDCCSWDGVTCDSATGYVIGLDLSCSWLLGSITSNSSLFLLRNLQMLNLAHNDFKASTVSSEFGNFASLMHLNLSSSSFSGNVPSSTSHLSNLVSLDLSNNLFQMTIEEPTFRKLVQNLTEIREIFLDQIIFGSFELGSLMNVSSSLTSLSLNYCELQGKFPEYVFHLPNLRLLSLHRNPELIGYIPKSNWTGPSEFLSLWDTSFSGELPDSIGNLESLKHLNFALCNFSGRVPRSLGNLSKLIHLDFAANSFSGHIPSSLINLTDLTFLRLSTNQLVGSIPNMAALFHSILYIDLSYNSLNGTLPSWLFSLSSLQYLYLHNNQLIGRIHEFQQTSLIEVDMRNNKFQGSIPSSISRLVNLTELDLSSNNLSGNLELDMFSELKNLLFLDLSHNSLSLSFNNNDSPILPVSLEFLFLSSCKVDEFPKFLKVLTNLQQLDLSHNGIQGHLPKWAWDMGKDSLSYLNLSHNLLTSLEEIPWRHIEVMDFRSNLIEGNLPVFPLSTVFFSISNNNLNGQISSQICNVSFLEVLDLSHNNLSGTIPECLGSFNASLSVLNLKMNNFSGTIPSRFAEDCGLKNININSNRLEGTLPRSMVNCRNIEVLDLGNNMMNDTFPHWLGNLSELQVLVLRSNKLHGSIRGCETENCFSNLRILDLSNNDFSGSLPSKYVENLKSMTKLGEGQSPYLEFVSDIGNQYGYSYDYSVSVVMKGHDRELVKILKIFKSIDLSNNKFRGEIPTSIGKLVSLKGLNLSHNSFSGHIPWTMGNLNALEWLDLSSNKLVGKIPKQLVGLTSLSSLNLSYNQLVGPLPQGKQFNTFENGSFEGNLGLCGFPLSKDCKEDEVGQPVPSSVDDSESENGFGWKVVLLGYGCGFLFGAMGYLVIRRG
ncbi:Receptor like protein 6, putative [Theobroma cacao]|uniref:Receptor like protein 6, putative n=1 Tax=Theobroma cacao TaxID=3641 RepID=A0A061FT59_THECC|nr:Receptor like protein 6, putative [Theobroma cacao]